MNNYVLTCCSTADLSKEHFDRRSIPVVYSHFELGGVDYFDDCGQSVPPKELFDRMLAGESTRTSQISAGEYMDFWRPFLEEGKDILHVSLSSGLSGTYNSACMAREELSEEFPDRKICIVDTLGASSGFGLIVETLADKRDEGMGLEELYNWAEENKLRMHHWFYSTDLTFFIRGGRVSKTAGFFGQMLNICPLLNMDYLGRLIPREKQRGKKKVIRRTLEMMEAHAENGLDYSGKCFISQADREEEAQELANMIEAKFPKLNGKVQIYPIGATIGAHTGPGTVALFFWGDKRED